ncbi:MAG TPA: GrpB family protein, partial [Rhabdochlamydiaceae bacterium]
MKKYVFKPYNPNFPALFEREKQRIASHLKEKALIEHVGSTAVPGLGGKGIIDIAIAVDKNQREAVSKELQAMGYILNPKGCTPERLFFYADLPDEKEPVRRYHIHLTDAESKDWKDFIAFREYLKSHPEEAQNYAALKEKAAAEAGGEGEIYRKLKDPLFKRVLEK